MRIVHVSDCYLPRLGGIELHVHDLAARQRRLGHDSVVLTTTPDRAEAAPTDVPTGRFEARGPFTPGRRRPAAASAARIATAAEVDVVHVHLSLVSPFAMGLLEAAVRAGVPVVATIHSVWDVLTTLPLRLARPTAARDWPVLWTAVSGTAARSFQRAMGGGTTVHVLANAVDVGPWRSIASARVDRPADQLRIVSVMRLAARKRPLQLVRILASIDRTLRGAVAVEAVIVGDGPRRGAVERMIRRRGVADRITLTGRLDRRGVSRALASADLYLAPARLESFGIAALEARCSGLPVLARTGGGVGDFISSGVDGLLVESDRAMAKAAVDLARDRPRLAALAEAATVSAPLLTWERALAQSADFYAAATCLRRTRRADPRQQPVSVVP